jgi:Flp pilus assembly protein TadD
MMKTIQSRLAIAVVLGLAASLPAAAMPSVTPAPAANSDFRDGERAVKEGRYQEAVALFNSILRREPDNADAHNYLGYSLRKLGDLDKAQQHYRTALQLKPDHKAALEYYGELFLQIKDLPRAEEQLARLERACPSGCTERAELEKAVKAYKAGS